MAEVKVAACCKINLFLQVTGKREDNYHTLSTLFLPVKGISDTIKCNLNSSSGINVRAIQPEIPSGKDNLIYRAAELYACKSGVSPFWEFVLDKQVPVAAGLGGGAPMPQVY